MVRMIRAALGRVDRPLGWAGVGGAALLLGACGTSLADRGIVQETVGRATERDILVEVPDILGESGFVISERRTSGRRISFETEWMRRAPFEDEAALGAEEARTRVIVTARRSAANLYTVDVRADNQLRGVATQAFAGTGWSSIPATDMNRDYIRQLALDIRLRIDAGVRIR